MLFMKKCEPCLLLSLTWARESISPQYIIIKKKMVQGTTSHEACMGVASINLEESYSTCGI
jgi:hypothetical protein